MWRILISSSHMRSVLDRYRPILDKERIDVILPKALSQYLTEVEMLESVDENLDGIICSDDRITRTVMEKAKHLKAISKWGVGLDSVDRIAAKELGIQVLNSPGAFNQSVSEMVIAYILWFARRPHHLHQSMKQGEWIKWTGRSLQSMSLGIIGIGNIGKTLTRHARGFGMTVLGNDIVEIDSTFIRETGIRMVDLESLLKESDVVSLNCDRNPSSEHLINRHTLALMKPSSYLINTARGPIIHQDDLIAALKQRTIAGAALDVFESEPLSIHSELLKLENVVLAPHNSFNTREAVEFVHQNTIMNMVNFLNKKA